MKKVLVYCVVPKEGSVRGVGIDKETAWKEAANNSGFTKEAMIEEGYHLVDGIVLDSKMFNELTA